MTQRKKLIGVLILSIIVSIGGVAYAVICGVSSDGGRGGAIAVGISFLALFAARPTARNVLEILDPETDEPVLQGRAIGPRIDLLRTAASSMVDSQRLEKIYLSWSSVLGTLTWGFGDVLALSLGASPG